MDVSPDPKDALLRATGLTVRFGARTVLRDVDLTVRPGEIVTLIGPNGAGKTTLVKAVLGLVVPAAGTVWQRPGLRLGYMPQRLQIDPTLPLTVRRFLRLWGRIAPGAIERVLVQVGAAAVVDAPVQVLSGGELQRVLLARALLQAPDLLVLDEPVQGVDVTGQAELYRLIDRIRRERGCGVLLVSHDLHLVMAQTDQVICLNGHVCCQGRPEAVTRHPDYLALFGRRDAASYAVYQHHHDHRHAPVGGGIVPLPQHDAAQPQHRAPQPPDKEIPDPETPDPEHRAVPQPHRHG